jgi:hypothetical protein
MAFGSLHGSSGFAQPSSIDVAARLPSLSENLWPQRYESPVWNARVKDELEQLLPTLVCSNQVELRLAQGEIARDWVAAYKRYFKTDVPLLAHRGAPIADEDDLEFAPVRYVAKNSAPIVLSLTFARR